MNLSTGNLLCTPGFTKIRFEILTAFQCNKISEDYSPLFNIYYLPGILEFFFLNFESFSEPAAPAPKAAQGDFAQLNASQLAEFDQFLLNNSYVSGFAPSQDDVVRFLQIKLVPEGLKNVARWWRHISSFQSEFDSLPGDRNQKPTPGTA